MKNPFRHYFRITLAYVGIVFLISLIHLGGDGALLRPGLAQADNNAIGLTKDNPKVKEAMEVQNRNKEWLKRIPGVVGVGTGIGPNDQPVIRVFTLRTGIKDIPKALENIPVHVKVTGQFIALSDPTARFNRPVPIGVSTGHPDITAGTIGARVKDNQGNVYALSNNHVYANINNAYNGDSALQPGTYDGGIDPDDKIGELCDFQPIDFSVFGSNLIDAAIVCTTTDEVGAATLPEGYGAPNSTIFSDSNSDGIFDNIYSLLLLPVQKFGRTTGLTHGEITEINVTSAICYANCSHPFMAQYAWFDYQIAIGSVNSNAFSLGGDSGSLIVTDDYNKNPVGLLFAGSSTTTLANRIDLVLDRFDVSIDDSPSTPTENHPPIADFSYTSTELEVSFTDLSSDSGGDIVSWSWDFGDGTGSAEQNPFHTYTTSGTYTVTLTVTDDSGDTDYVSKDVAVSEVISGISLLATGVTVRDRNKVNLEWIGATSKKVDIRRNNVNIATTQNDGRYTDNLGRTTGTFTYQICETGTSTCSDEQVVEF